MIFPTLEKSQPKYRSLTVRGRGLISLIFLRYSGICIIGRIGAYDLYMASLAF